MRKIAPTLTRAWVRAGLALAAASLAGCIAATRQENAALAMGWPDPPARDLGAYAAPVSDYPTVGGDILKGASPADQAKARAEAVPPLDLAPPVKGAGRGSAKSAATANRPNPAQP